MYGSVCTYAWRLKSGGVKMGKIIVHMDNDASITYMQIHINNNNGDIDTDEVTETIGFHALYKQNC